MFDCLAYVAGPYRSSKGMWGVWQNIQRASEIAHQLWYMKIPTICPHRNTMFFDNEIPQAGSISEEVFLAGDILILRRCDLLVIYDGWDSSFGTMGEVAEADRIGIPVFMWPDQREGILSYVRRRFKNEVLE